MLRLPMGLTTTICSVSLLFLAMSQVHADSMGTLIAQKSVQPDINARYESAYASVPSARVSTRSTIQRTANSQSNYNAIITTATGNDFNQTNPRATIHAYQSPQPASTTQNAYRYPEVTRGQSMGLPPFLSGNYDNVDSQYLPILGDAEQQSSVAAREVISTARTMALNERAIIQGGCWDYLNAVFKRAGVTRNTVHKGVYRQGPYASSNEIEAGDWLYYINHGYKGIEHSGLFIGWVDESAKQALILSYAGENRREPARYKVYDLSNVYQIMRPTI